MIFTDEKQIQELITPIINAYRKVDQKLLNKDYKTGVDDLPDFYPNYKAAVRAAERIRIHAEIGEFPDRLFKNRHPNQTGQEFLYMKANYKQNTLPVFIDYINTNARAFSDGNWSIEYDDKNGDSDFQRYVENDIEVVGSLKNYLKTLLPTIKGVDANGVIAVKPERVFVIRDEQTQEEFIDDTQLVNPQPYYYPIKNVLTDPYYDDDYVIIELTEKSEVVRANKKQRAGHIFEVYDEDQIWRVEQTGKFEDYEFIVYVYYYHGAGRVMAQRLKGVPHYVNGSWIWTSPFLYACDLLDMALTNSNFLQCTIANAMFPYRVMLGNKCNNQIKDDAGNIWRCEEGLIFRDGVMITCSKCHGTGNRDRVSPVGGQMILNPGDVNSGSEGDAKFSGKAMEYVAPPTEPSEFVLKKIEMDFAKAYEVSKIRRVSNATGQGIDPANGTATKEILDQKSQYSAVKLFSDQCFSLFEFMLNAIGWQRYGTKYSKPVITSPVSFDFNTEADYLSQITAAQNANLAPAIIENIIYKYLQTIYFNQKKTSAVFNLITSTDRLIVLKQDDILMKLNKGLVEPWEIILHDSSRQLIDTLMMQHADAEFCDMDDCTKGFFALDFADQQTLLIDLAKKRAGEIKAAGGAVISLLDRARQNGNTAAEVA